MVLSIWDDTQGNSTSQSSPNLQHRHAAIKVIQESIVAQEGGCKREGREKEGEDRREGRTKEGGGLSKGRGRKWVGKGGGGEKMREGRKMKRKQGNGEARKRIMY